MGAERARDLPEFRRVRLVGPVGAEAIGVRGLVLEGLDLVPLGKVRRDHDRVRRPVSDVPARELSPRDPDAGRVQAEALREAVVDLLEPRALIRVDRK